MDLLADLKSRYGQAEITVSDNQIKVQFKKAKEAVWIVVEDDNRYTVSYPRLKKVARKNEYIDDFTTSKCILKEGMFGILNQVQQNGKFLPEFMW